jgi:hypothetical protein
MVSRGSLWFFGRWPTPDRLPASYDVSDISSLLRSTLLTQTPFLPGDTYCFAPPAPTGPRSFIRLEEVKRVPGMQMTAPDTPRCKRSQKTNFREEKGE